MILALTIFMIGLLLSAFFSGSETGLYRVSRTRLVLDGLSGSRVAKGMVWLLNHPAIFVATTLVGNNVANYMTSLAIVIGVQQWFTGNAVAELLGPMMLTPVVFVFGELLPKYLFFHAPYKLLKATRPLLIVATFLFAPISLLLGLLGNLLQSITGQTPFQLRLTMARRELDQVLRAGHEAGLLGSSQRELATRLFEIGNRPAIQFGVPTDRLAVVDDPVDRAEAKQSARRVNHPIILVSRGGALSGFVRYADVMVGSGALTVESVVRGRTTESHLKILLRLYDAISDVAVLYDAENQAKCVVTRRQLLSRLTK